MSRSCAKPTCSSPAVSWFDLRRVTQQVVRSSSPTDHGIALCAAHADRFGVPSGWTVVTGEPTPARVADASQVNKATAKKHAPAKKQAAAKKRRTAKKQVAKQQETESEIPVNAVAQDRGSAWFVPSADASEENEGSPSLGAPSEGSMLYRAFNGPEKKVVAKAKTERVAAESDELSPRRRARSTSDDAEEEAPDAYETFELPFPPHADPRSIAVS